MSDVTHSLIGQASLTKSDEEKFQLFGSSDDIVGALANYFQVLGIPGVSGMIGMVLDYLKGSPPSAELLILENLQNQVADLVNLSGVQESEIKMLSLIELIAPVNSNLEILATETAAGRDVSPEFLEQALVLLNAVLEFDTYWYRPLVLSRTCTPADTSQGLTTSWAGVEIDPPYRLIPPLSDDPIGGFSTVFDPQFALPVFLKAIDLFLCTGALLNPEPAAFGAFIAQWTPKLGQVADFLQDLYDGSLSAAAGAPRKDTLVGGLLKAKVPHPDELFNYIRNAIPGTRPGFGWAGIYGVIDIHGVYLDPLDAPAHASSHLVDVFVTTGLAQLGDLMAASADYQDSIYPWLTWRVTLGMMARHKAVYLLLGYDKAWSILQKLRVLTKQQGAVLPDGNKNWSARELIATLGLPTSASNQVPGGESPDYSLSDLVERLDQIGRGTWNSAPDSWNVVLSQRKFGLTYDPTNRPVSFRNCLAAAAA